MPTPAELIEKAQQLYDRCKAFPERDPAGMMALLELRNLVPDLITQLRADAEFIDLPRGHETRQQLGGTVR